LDQGKDRRNVEGSPIHEEKEKRWGRGPLTKRNNGDLRVIGKQPHLCNTQLLSTQEETGSRKKKLKKTQKLEGNVRTGGNSYWENEASRRKNGAIQ